MVQNHRLMCSIVQLAEWSLELCILCAFTVQPGFIWLRGPDNISCESCRLNKIIYSGKITFAHESNPLRPLNMTYMWPCSVAVCLNTGLQLSFLLLNSTVWDVDKRTQTVAIKITQAILQVLITYGAGQARVFCFFCHSNSRFLLFTSIVTIKNKTVATAIMFICFVLTSN